MSIFFVLGGGAKPASAEQLVLYAVNYPPYEIEKPGKDGLRGFDVEVIIEAFARSGVDADVAFMPWKRIMLLAEDGQVAGAVSCAYQKKRERHFYFTDPISTSTHSFVHTDRYEGKPLESLEDATGLKVLVVSGYSSEAELKRAGMEYETTNTDNHAISLLLERSYDLFYTTREFMEYQAKKDGYADRIGFFDLRKLQYHLCLSRKWPESEKLVRQFNKGLAEIMADGTYNRIHEKYR
ncbi:substrate-binding periplasmic protein [Sneathiella sp.]|uniref:substrate-binding periplasmic protein n=1 Tax=Sneathiella sp. TaxID=1964365 RepID=UPI0039E708E9